MTTSVQPAPDMTVADRRRLLRTALAAGGVFVLTTLLALGSEPLPGEIAVFEAVNDLPDWLYYVIWPFMQYGTFVTIPMVSLVALVTNRRRLAVMLLTSGVGIYLGAKVVKDLTARGRPGAFLDTVNAREHFADDSLGYTSGHLAVAATIATLTVHHLSPPWRRVTVALVAIVAVGRMYVGAHLPLDMIGGVAMGVATGTAVTYLFGHGDPDRHQEDPVLTDTSAPAGAGPDRSDAGLPPATSGRHPGDAVRVGLGLAVLAVSLLAVQRDRLTRFEGDLFRLINRLPAQLEPVLEVVMQAGNVGAAAVGAALMLIVARRHRRAALDVAAAGVLAWFAAKAVKDAVQRPRPTGFFDDVARFTGEGLGFVSGHTAVAAALVTAAAPYLPRRWRRVLWLLPFVVGFTRIYFGAHLPLDVIGGAALGWVIGAGIHLLLGAPHRVPGLDEAAAVLRRTGREPTDLRRVPGTPKGSFPFVATIGGTQVFIKLLDPEPRDRDRLYRAARFLAFRDVRDEAAVLDASAQANREAAMTLLAASNGVRVPAIREIERDREQVWIVQQHVDGRDLGRLPADAVGDELLRDLWTQVARLHTARVAHRDLVAANVLADADDRAWIVDFAHAESAASTRTMDNDVAELLTTTALLVGPERAVAAASSALDRDALRRALPELQPLSLTTETRRRLRDTDLLERLRSQVAEHCGIDLEIDEPARRSPVRPATAIAAAVLVAVALVALAGPTDVWDAVRAPAARWLGLAVVALAVVELAGAAGTVAAVNRRLAVGRTALARFAADGVAVLDGRPAGRDTLAAHLARFGVPPSETGGGLRLLGLGRLSTSLAALAVAVIVAGNEGLDVDLPDHAAWLVALAAVALLLPVAATRAAGARPGPRGGAEPPNPTADRPILGLAVIVETAAGIVVAVAAAAAAGGDAPVAGGAVAHVLVTLLAAHGPAPGAPGAGEVVMTAGLVAFGMPFGPAVVAALLVRALLVWVPVVAGFPLRRITPGG